MIIAIASTYPLQLFVVTDLLEEAIFQPGRLSNDYKAIKVFVFRCLLVLGTAGIAISVPDFGLLMGLIGTRPSLCSELCGQRDTAESSRSCVTQRVPFLSTPGALGSTALQFIFPALFHLKLFPENPIHVKALYVCYVLFGLGGTVRTCSPVRLHASLIPYQWAGGILGTYQTIREIIEKYFT